MRAAALDPAVRSATAADLDPHVAGPPEPLAAERPPAGSAAPDLEAQQAPAAPRVQPASTLEHLCEAIGAHECSEEERQQTAYDCLVAYANSRDGRAAAALAVLRHGLALGAQAAATFGLGRQVALVENYAGRRDDRAEQAPLAIAGAVSAGAGGSVMAMLAGAAVPPLLAAMRLPVFKPVPPEVIVPNNRQGGDAVRKRAEIRAMQERIASVSSPANNVAASTLFASAAAVRAAVEDKTAEAQPGWHAGLAAGAVSAAAGTASGFTIGAQMALRTYTDPESGTRLPLFYPAKETVAGASKSPPFLASRAATGRGWAERSGLIAFAGLPLELGKMLNAVVDAKSPAAAAVMAGVEMFVAAVSYFSGMGAIQRREKSAAAGTGASAQTQPIGAASLTVAHASAVPAQERVVHPTGQDGVALAAQAQLPASLQRSQSPAQSFAGLGGELGAPSSLRPA